MNPTESERSAAGLATRRVDHAEAIERLRPKIGGQGQLLPLLHALQHEFGYIDDVLVPLVAEALNVSRADVHGVLTFYHDFRRVPAGRHVVKICRAESCRARGGMAVERAILGATGIALGDTTADGRVTVERIHCFGLCAIGPNVMIDGRLRSRVDGGGVAIILDEVAA